MLPECTLFNDLFSSSFCWKLINVIPMVCVNEFIFSFSETLPSANRGVEGRGGVMQLGGQGQK